MPDADTEGQLEPHDASNDRHRRIICVLADERDPAFENSTKSIGPVDDEDEARVLLAVRAALS